MRPLLLREFHSRLGAGWLDVGGAETVANYGDWLAEHHALRSSAGVVDLSGRSRLVLLGADRQKMLNGQVTNNVKDLQPGQGCYAALVNAKARMLSDVFIYALPDELLLDFEPGLGPSVAARLEKFIIADDVQVIDAAPHYGLLSVQGPRAHRVVEQLGIFRSLPATALAFETARDTPHGSLYLMNQARAGSRGFDLFVPNTGIEAVADELLAAAKGAGGRFCGWEALEVARIEAGIPRFGVDMDETNLPPEAGIADRAVSYTKGCYSGQEVIARIRTYGQVAKALRGLRLSVDANSLPVRGAKLFKGDRDVGYITSSVWSPILDSAIALGYVRREANAPATELALRASDSTPQVVIVPLPFVGPALA